jgi:hypothetical protein
MRRKKGFEGPWKFPVWKYADGSVWEAVEGRDFFVRPLRFVQQLKDLCRVNGYWVRANICGARRVEFMILPWSEAERRGLVTHGRHDATEHAGVWREWRWQDETDDDDAEPETAP